MSNLLEMMQEKAAEEMTVRLKVRDKPAFIRMIDETAGFCAEVESIPVLKGMLLQVKTKVPKRTANGMEEVDGVALFTTGSNSNQTLIKGYAAEFGQDIMFEADAPIEALVPAGRFAELLKKLPQKAEWIFEFNAGNGEEDYGFLNIRCGESEYMLQLLNVSEYPQTRPESVPPLAFSSKEFCSALHNSKYASEKKTMDSPIAGIHLICREEGKIIVETTNRRQASVETLAATTLRELDMIISHDTVDRIYEVFGKHEGRIVVQFGTATITVNGFGSTLISRVVEGKYPDLSKMVPNGIKAECIVLQKDLLGAFERCLLMVVGDKENSSCSVSVRFGNGVLALSAKGQLGKAEDCLEVETDGDASFLIDPARAKNALKSLSSHEKVRIQFIGALRPIIFYPDASEYEDYTKFALVLPLRAAEG